MKLTTGDLVHVYNRGNNKQQIFFNENNYHFFIRKVKSGIGSVSDILSYCLMPNHFHFLIQVTEDSIKLKRIGSLMSNELQNGFRVLQSSYASAINKEQRRTGSLFQQNTKFKLLNDGGSTHSYMGTYAEVCFHYIHQNPLKAGLVKQMEDWKFSSFSEYLGYSSLLNKSRLTAGSGTDDFSYDSGFCNKDLAFKLFNIEPAEFYKISYNAIRPELLDKIF